LVHSGFRGKLQCDYGKIMHLPETHSTKPVRLAIYDMDKTITRKASFGPFILHVVRHYAPGRAVMLPVMGLVTMGYALGLLSRARLKEINLRLLLGRQIARARAARIAESFAAETLETNTLPGAVAQIAADRAEGYRIILATASYSFYVDAIARKLGIADVIATDCMELDADHFAPRIEGENCYDRAKLRKVKAWLAQQGIARDDADVRFYSDHVSDAHCLIWADQAHATNPHAPLRRMAAERGWKVHDWG